MSEEEPEYKLNDGDYCANMECAQGVLQEVAENLVECQTCCSLFNMTTGEMLKDGEHNEGIEGVKSDGLDDLFDDEE